LARGGRVDAISRFNGSGGGGLCDLVAFKALDCAIAIKTYNYFFHLIGLKNAAVGCLLPWGRRLVVKVISGVGA